MPEKETIKRARRDKQQGKAASTQAGEFVREEMHHIRDWPFQSASCRSEATAAAQRQDVGENPKERGFSLPQRSMGRKSFSEAVSGAIKSFAA
jgi:hypothetical protein